MEAAITIFQHLSLGACLVGLGAVLGAIPYGLGKFAGRRAAVRELRQLSADDKLLFFLRIAEIKADGAMDGVKKARLGLRKALKQAGAH